MGATDLRVLSKNPYNAEPPSLQELTKHAITPLRLAYARNHSDIKDLTSGAEKYTVKIDSEIDGIKEISITFKDLRDSFPRKEVVAALVCAGNRRAKMAETTGRKVQGINWSEGTISNVRWAGAPLRDVLIRAGVAEDGESLKGLHACFASNVAPCEQDSCYGGSIPLEKAMSEDGDALLAYEMNGEPLTPDHGFPLRVVIPGYGGMRWVKWVDQITISRKESTNFYQQKDYKILPDSVTSKDMADSQGWWSQVPSMQHLPCNSVVTNVRCSPSSCPDELTVKASGYAYSHCPVSRVEISADGGETWKETKITYQEGEWSWALWEGEVDIELDEEGGNGMLAADELLQGKNGRRKFKVTVLSRAIDSAGNAQDTGCPWNLRGVGYCGAGEGTVEV
ncbi:Oxidoreductase, molybdopterin-binding domain-containing protein [Melanogaster broomeanus]|nr:Oxidoreductase, molybdopterin-binding domain-containing protein [Melanogaster broomeanus]